MFQCNDKRGVMLWYHFLFLLGGAWLMIAPTTSAFTVGTGRTTAAAPITTRTKSRVGDSRLPSQLFVTLDDIMIMPLITNSAASTTTSTFTTMPMSPTNHEFPSILLVSSTTAVSNALQDIVQQPEVEAEVLVDMSHLVVDFSFLSNLSKDATNCIMQSCREQQSIRSMVGRILVLCADWLPDHHIFPEELAIQGFFLILGLLQLFRVISMEHDDGSEH